MQSGKTYTVGIIGSGPAGIACAIQLKRFGLDCAVFEKNKFGGFIENANLVENYLGFPKGIKGIEFVKLMKTQFDSYEIDFLNLEIIEISQENELFALKLSSGLPYTCKYLVVATGTKPKTHEKLLNLSSDKVFYDVSEMSGISNLTVTIIGAGDAAFDYALNLSRSNKISIINRGNAIKALPLLVDRVKINSNINYIEDFDVATAIEEPNKVLIFDKKGRSVESDVILVAIGRNPDDELLNKQLKENSNLFIIGDVKNGMLRQTSIATADGLKTAAEIYERNKT